MSSSQFYPLFHNNLDLYPVPECGSKSKRPESSARRHSEQKPGVGRRSAPANRIVLIGRIHELALYRAEVLSNRGFEVRTSTNKDEALKLIRRADFDAVVLSYTLPNDAVQELAEEMREHCPHCPLVVITKTKLPDRRIAPDAIAVADEGPKALVAALRRVLRQH